MKYSIVTFGCRVNQADSFGVEEELRSAGAVAAPPESADVVIVNTCSVTATADQGARQTIRRIARANPSVRIVVTGCYATRKPDELTALPNVVRVVGNDDKPRLLPMIAAASAEHAGDSEARVFSTLGDGPCGAAIEPGVAGRTAFTLRVQTGCAEPCSYCIIPTTRGTPRSAPMDHLLREVDRIVEAGFKEIAITGVHLGSYGRDLTPQSSLLELLRAFERSAGRRDDRTVLFRISSLEPMDCTREIVDLVATADCFAPHLHLPLQHASRGVLRAMRRPYTIEYYSDLVNGIRARIPHASIGSDVIVGFPGESDEDFEQLVAYLETAPLTHIHVFPYSDRPGTGASAMREKVPGAIIRERGRRIREIGRQLTQRFLDAQVGTTHRGLTLEDGSIVVTGNYLKIRVPPIEPRNTWVTVRLTSHDYGELLRG